MIVNNFGYTIHVISGFIINYMFQLVFCLEIILGADESAMVLLDWIIVSIVHVGYLVIVLDPLFFFI